MFNVSGKIPELNKQLLSNPVQGTPLGKNAHKIRLAVRSKGKGKSGGYRVITYLVNQSNQDIFINMLTLYDKSEEGSITKQHLLALSKEI